MQCCVCTGPLPALATDTVAVGTCLLANCQVGVLIAFPRLTISILVHVRSLMYSVTGVHKYANCQH